MLKLGISCSVIVAAVAYVGATLWRKPHALDYFFLPSELLARGNELNYPVTVAGIVGTSTTYAREKELVTLLDLMEPLSVEALTNNTGAVDSNAHPLAVSYSGKLPPGFGRGRAVVVHGLLSEGAFQATAMTTQCGKYEVSELKKARTSPR